jgi:hypothetical protein
MSTAPAPRVLPLLPSLLLWLLVVTACAPSQVQVEIPRVSFEAPPGLTLYVDMPRVALRVDFRNEAKLAPFVCPVFEGQLRTEPVTDNVRYLLERVARRPASRRVKLFGPGDKLLAVGALCIFPTLRTKQADILQQYRIRITPEALDRLRAGRKEALFEGYVPTEEPQPGWKNLAWVLYLEPAP